MDRRGYLGSLLATPAVVTAGCLSAVFGASGVVEPEAPPPATPSSLDCPDPDLERLPAADADIPLGDTDGFELRIDEPTYTYGELAEIELACTSIWGETGAKSAFNVEMATGSGWEDIRVSPVGPLPHPSVAVNHDLGTAFTWEIELTEEGIIDAGAHREYEVCPPLQSARYRFVFRRVGDEGAAVEFNLVVD